MFLKTLVKDNNSMCLVDGKATFLGKTKKKIIFIRKLTIVDSSSPKILYDIVNQKIITNANPDIMY